MPKGIFKRQPHTEEAKRKISEANKGKKRSIEVKEKMSKARKGKKSSAETKARMSEIMKGKTIHLGYKNTEETKKRMSDSHKGKKASEATKKKIGENSRKYWLSEEARKKMSDIQKGNTHSLGYKYTEEQKEKVSGENSIFWKGDDVGYIGAHAWMNKVLGKASDWECVYCGSTDKLEWASISHGYKRDVNDYIPLCKVCHCKYDGITRLEKEDAVVIRFRLALGETQSSIAEDYNISRRTISNIKNHKIKYYE